MRFLFVPYSVAGHVHPMLPVMARLAARGATVRALVGPGFAAAARAAGAEAVPLAAVPDVFVPERFAGRAALRFVAGRARRVVVNRAAARNLRAELVRDRPDLVVLDPMLGWADRVARRLAVPSIVFSTTFAMNAYAAAVVARRCGLKWTAGLQQFRPLVRRHEHRLVLANTLPALQPARENLDARTHLVGPLLRRPVGEREPGPRCLFVSPGTVYARGPALFRAVAASFAGTDWSVIMATGHTDPRAVGPVPANVTVRRWVDQPAVLARADAFLTHAGMNSVVEALAAGVPMVVAPRSAEQRFIAEQVVALGVAVYFEPSTVLRRVNALVRDRAVQAAATAWRYRLAGAGGAARAADLLLAEVNAQRRRAAMRTVR